MRFAKDRQSNEVNQLEDKSCTFAMMHKDAHHKNSDEWVKKARHADHMLAKFARLTDFPRFGVEPRKAHPIHFDPSSSMPKVIASMVDPRDVKGTPEKFVEEMKYTVGFDLGKHEGTVPDNYQFPDVLTKNQAFFVVSKLFEDYSGALGYNSVPTFRIIAITLFNLRFVPPLGFTVAQRAEYDARFTVLIMQTLRAYSRWRIDELKWRITRRRQLYNLSRFPSTLRSLAHHEIPSMETISALLAVEDRLAEEDALVEAKNLLAIENAKIETEAEVRSQYESSDADSIISSDGERELGGGKEELSAGEKEVEEQLMYPDFWLDKAPVPSSQPDEIELPLPPPSVVEYEPPRSSKRTRRPPIRYSPSK
ncbi:hypothetical protein C8J56DRAFT_904378 [Mycena floridula]|nr:hypothetical protein C8J56DRAFT_904378 [Mycena floridula]